MGVSVKAKKFELSPSVGYHHHQRIESLCPLITDQILEKKVSVTAFREICSKKMCQRHAFSATQSWFIWKSSLVLNFLIQSSIQQDYPPELYPITHPPKHLWETLGMGKNPTQQPKIYSFTPLEKFALINLLFSLSKMSFPVRQIVIFI